MVPSVGMAGSAAGPALGGGGRRLGWIGPVDWRQRGALWIRVGAGRGRGDGLADVSDAGGRR